MGFKTIINTLLRLSITQGLDLNNFEVGKTYHFEKKEERIYPLHVPVPLLTEDWKYVGLVNINEITLGNGSTKGIYTVITIFDKETSDLFFSCFGKPE